MVLYVLEGMFFENPITSNCLYAYIIYASGKNIGIFKFEILETTNILLQ